MCPLLAAPKVFAGSACTVVGNARCGSGAATTPGLLTRALPVRAALLPLAVAVDRQPSERGQQGDGARPRPQPQGVLRPVSAAAPLPAACCLLPFPRRSVPCGACDSLVSPSRIALPQVPAAAGGEQAQEGAGGRSRERQCARASLRCGGPGGLRECR